MNDAMHWVTPEDPMELRRTLGCFATGITIVTGTTSEGVRFGLTASSFQALSLAPPLVLYSVRKSAASVGLVKSSGRFCVNVLRHEHADLAKRFAAPIPDRFADREWHTSELGNPMLPDAMASFDCHLWTTYDGGDHEIIVGEVAAIRRAGKDDPLLCFQGEFHPIGSSRNTVCEKVRT
jgi:flavin reductase (DIM6/NTAB) family NADH-FMN oxidoreductase RutF